MYLPASLGQRAKAICVNVEDMTSGVTDEGKLLIVAGMLDELQEAVRARRKVILCTPQRASIRMRKDTEQRARDCFKTAIKATEEM